MTSMLRVCVVGVGSIARRYHLPSLARLAADGLIALEAVCDVVAERAHAAATTFGFTRAYADYRQMLDTVRPDAVWVLVPISAMREVAGHFLSSGVPTFMEKPPGASSRETRELLALAQTHRTPHQVAFNRRYAPLVQRMAGLLRQMGECQGVSCQFYRVRRGEQGFAFGTALHGLDAMCFFQGGTVHEVHTRYAPRGCALVTLCFRGGGLGTMEMRPLVGVQSERYTAHAGERTVVVDGVVEWLAAFPGYLECYDAGICTLREQPAVDTPPEEASGFYGESAHFVRCLLGGVAPEPDLSEALRSVRVAEAVQEGRDLVLDEG